MGLRGARAEHVIMDEAVIPPAGERAMESSRGWRNLPLKEQGLARAIVAGFAAELDQHRQIMGQQRQGDLRASVEGDALAAELRRLHVKGSLHPADRGEVCEFDGESWPCRTIQSLAGL